MLYVFFYRLRVELIRYGEITDNTLQKLKRIGLSAYICMANPAKPYVYTKTRRFLLEKI